jgi:hypothetical protein
VKSTGIEQHWGQNLRQAVQQIEAAEIKVIDAQPGSTRTAA